MLLDSETTHGLYLLSITATTELGMVTWNVLLCLPLFVTATMSVGLWESVNHHGDWGLGLLGMADNLVAEN